MLHPCAVFPCMRLAALVAALAVSSSAFADAPTNALACRYNGEAVARVQFDGTDYYFSDSDGTARSDSRSKIRSLHCPKT